ncbi:MAG: hypothetical protein NVS1B1_09020 [Candidatus Limnocylindrales bacterium]
MDRHRRDSPHVRPLFPDALALDRAQYERTGIIPPYTIVVVKNAALAAHPWLTEALYAALLKAKARGSSPGPSIAEIVQGDPLPYGRSVNRRGFELLIRLCREQRILDDDASVDELFPALD